MALQESLLLLLERVTAHSKHTMSIDSCAMTRTHLPLRLPPHTAAQIFMFLRAPVALSAVLRRAAGILHSDVVRRLPGLLPARAVVMASGSG